MMVAITEMTVAMSVLLQLLFVSLCIKKKRAYRAGYYLHFKRFVPKLRRDFRFKIILLFLVTFKI